MDLQPAPEPEWLKQSRVERGSSPIDIDPITPEILASGLEAALCPEMLRANQVKSILVLLPEEERTGNLLLDEKLSIDWSLVPSHLTERGEVRPELRDAGVQEISFVGIEDGARNSSTSITEAVSELDRLSKTCPPVLVHCSMGRSRTPAIISAYLALDQNTSLKEAVDHIAAKRSVQINFGLARSISRALGLRMQV